MLWSLICAVGAEMLYWMLHLENGSSFPKPLSAKEERAALERLRSGDETARSQLIEHNLRLVTHIIKKYYAAGTEQEDLISIGTIGLIKAVNTFDCEKGTRLTTYAARCIENEILMYFRQKKKSAQDVSMNEPMDTDNDGNPLTLCDMLYTEDTVCEDLDHRLQLQKLQKLIRRMPAGREKKILIERYGLDGNLPKTQNELAGEMGISRSYVSRIEKKALQKLRAQFENGNED